MSSKNGCSLSSLIPLKPRRVVGSILSKEQTKSLAGVENEFFPKVGFFSNSEHFFRK